MDESEIIREIAYDLFMDNQLPQKIYDYVIDNYLPQSDQEWEKFGFTISEYIAIYSDYFMVNEPVTDQESIMRNLRDSVPTYVGYICENIFDVYGESINVVAAKNFKEAASLMFQADQFPQPIYDAINQHCKPENEGQWQWIENTLTNYIYRWFGSFIDSNDAEDQIDNVYLAKQHLNVTLRMHTADLCDKVYDTCLLSKKLLNGTMD